VTPRRFGASGFDMRFALLAALLLGQSVLSGCAGTGGGGQVDDFSSSMRGGIGKNTDTYGTQRRVDVYGGSTAPSLPSIGAVGMGK
jgi:hypothetical protein